MRARSLVATLVSVLLLAAAPPLPAAEDGERRPAAVGEFFPQVLEDLYGATLQVTNNVVIGTYDPLSVPYVGLWVTPSLTTGTSQYGIAINPTFSSSAGNTFGMAISRTVPDGVQPTWSYGLNINNPALSGSGSIGTNIGLRIDNMTAGTTDYAIYTNQGQVRFGDAVTMTSAPADANPQLLLHHPSGGPSYIEITNSDTGATKTDGIYFGIDQNEKGWLWHWESGKDIGFATASTEWMRLTSTGTLQAPDYASETTGWAITENGAGDFRYLFSNEMRIKLFTADLESVLRGSAMVSKSFGLTSRDFTCPADGGTSTLYVWDAPDLPNGRVFANSDWVSLQLKTRSDGDSDGNLDLTVADCVGTVSGYVDLATGEQAWTFTRGNPDGGTMTASTVIDARDTLVIDYGVSGNGVTEQSAVDGAEQVNAPYFQVKTWTTAPTASNWSVRARLGKLTGITGTADEFGLFAGNYGSGSSGQYIRASNETVALHNVNFSMYEGATEVFKIDRTLPSLALGSPIPTGPTTGKGVWMGRNGGATYFDFRVGDPAGGQLFWDGSANAGAGELTMAGFKVTNQYVMSSDQLVGIGTNADWAFWACNANCGAGLNFRVRANGELTAKYGTVGGWTLGQYTLTSSSGTVGLNSQEVGGADIRMWAGHATPASAPFYVTETGVLNANGGGNIGGWTIGGSGVNALYTAGGSGAGMSPSDYPFFGGAAYASRASAPFRVTNAGALTATNATISGSVTAGVGTIGGWTLASNYLTAGSAGTTVRLDSGGSNPAFSAGSATPASAPFRVTTAGALTATNATLTGSLSAASGNVNINSSGITLQSGGTYFFQWTDGSQMGSNSVLYIDGPTAGAGDMYLSAGTDYRWNGSAYYPYYTNAVDLGRSSNYWKDLYIAGIIFDPPNSTASDNPLVRYAGDGRIYEKTDVVSLTCTSGNVVINPVFEAGMLVGGTCAANPPAPAPDEAAALRDEVADLRARVANLEALVERLLAAPNRPTEVGFSRPGLTLPNVPCVTVDPGGVSGSVVPCGGSK